MRAAFLPMDRADLGNHVKNLSRRMQQPSEVDVQPLKKAWTIFGGKATSCTTIRNFLSGFDRPCVKIMVDSDNAGVFFFLNTTRSTVGRVAFLGNHVVQHACNLLQVTLSSAENEYYTISAGRIQGWDYNLFSFDWSVNASVRIAADFSAARRFTETRTWLKDETHRDQLLAEARTTCKQRQLQ